MPNNPFFLFVSSLRGVCDFKALDSPDREIVFYAEDSFSWVYFETIINELVETYGKKICYLTSSAEDPILTSQRDGISSFYIGSGLARTYLFFTLRASTMVMTMPDLETYNIKRSRAKQIHYVYVFHGLVSTTMVYRFGAFDHFDALLCVGPYQIEEIRAQEKLYALKPKILIENGYGRLDSIFGQIDSRSRTVSKKGKRTILIAPTWGDQALLETCAFQLVDILIEAGYQIIYRPHPMTLRHQKNLLIELKNRFSQHKGFKIETDIGSQHSLYSSDIMITDWSGTAIEYAFGLEHPVIFIDLPRKVNNSEYQKIPLEPFEVTIRSQIGVIISSDSLNDIPMNIEELCSNPDSFVQRIRKIRSKSVFNLGKSGVVGAAYIAKTV